MYTSAAVSGAVTVNTSFNSAEWLLNGTEWPQQMASGSGSASVQTLPSQRDSLYIVIPMTIAYCFIFITGVVGNIVTCIVIARNKYMHTATNYYLFSLSLSDLLLLITGLPQEIVSFWYKYPYMFGEAFCVLRGLAAETSANATVLTITAFTVERYIAICYPFLSHTMSNLSRAVRIVLVIWLVALLFAVPHAAQVGVIAPDGHPEFATCTVRQLIIKHSFELSIIFFFVAPMTIITVLYALIGLKLRRTNALKRDTGGSFYKMSREPTRRHVITNQSSRRVVKMLVAVVAAFFICWAPFHAQRLVAIYGIGEDKRPKEEIIVHIYGVLTYISGVLYYLSATINPILYHIMSLKFREAFKETFVRRRRRRWRRRQRRTCQSGRRLDHHNCATAAANTTSSPPYKQPQRRQQHYIDYHVLGGNRNRNRRPGSFPSCSSCSTDNSIHSASNSCCCCGEYGNAISSSGLKIVTSNTDDVVKPVRPLNNNHNNGLLLSPSDVTDGSVRSCEQRDLLRNKRSVFLRLQEPSSSASCFAFLHLFRNSKPGTSTHCYISDQSKQPYEMAVNSPPRYTICLPRPLQRDISNSSLKDYADHVNALNEELAIYTENNALSK